MVDTTQEDAEKRAKYQLEEDPGNVDNVQVCPVCGAESLVLYWDSPTDPDNEGIVIYRATCLCCTFSVDNELDNVKIDGLDVEKLWQVR